MLFCHPQAKRRRSFPRALILMPVILTHFMGLLLKSSPWESFSFCPGYELLIFWCGSYSNSVRVDAIDALSSCQHYWTIGSWLFQGLTISGSGNLLLPMAAALLAASHDGEHCVSEAPLKGAVLTVGLGRFPRRM